MMVRRTLEGASKWAFRDFLREECIASKRSASVSHVSLRGKIGFRTCVDLRHCDEVVQGG